MISRFTTGAARDDTPPMFAGEIKMKFHPPVSEGGTCGVGRWGRVTIEWPLASDEAGPVRYTLYRHNSGQTEALPYVGGTLVEGYYVCSGNPAPQGMVEILPGSYSVQAMDMAGGQYRIGAEVAPPYELCQGPAPLPADAGVSDVRPAIEGEDGRDGRGIGCNLGSRNNLPSLVSLITVVMLLWRRSSR